MAVGLRFAFGWTLLAALLAASAACISAAPSDPLGRSPGQPIPLGQGLGITGQMSVKVLDITRNAQFNNNYQEPYVPRADDQEPALVWLEVTCNRTDRCRIDSGDFTLQGIKGVLYAEEEQFRNVTDHLATILPQGTFDVIGFDFGETEIPGGRTRTGNLVFIINEADSDFILSYRDSYFWIVPTDTLNVVEAPTREPD